MVQLRIARTDFSDEPLLLAVAVDFGRSMEDRTVWNAWQKSGGLRVMRQLLEHPQQMEISLDVLKPDFAPTAERAAGIVLRCCDLNNRQAIVSNVVQRLQNATELIGYKPSRQA
jgi:hypothetical protein